MSGRSDQCLISENPVPGDGGRVRSTSGDGSRGGVQRSTRDGECHTEDLWTPRRHSVSPPLLISTPREVLTEDA